MFGAFRRASPPVLKRVFPALATVVLLVTLASVLATNRAVLDRAPADIVVWALLTIVVYFGVCTAISFVSDPSPRLLFHRDRFFVLCVTVALYALTVFLALVLPFSTEFLVFHSDCEASSNVCMSLGGFVAYVSANLLPLLFMAVELFQQEHRYAYRDPWVEMIICTTYITVQVTWSVVFFLVTKRWPSYLESIIAGNASVSVLVHVAAIFLFLGAYWAGRSVALARRHRLTQKHFADSLLESLEDTWTEIPDAEETTFNLDSEMSEIESENSRRVARILSESGF